MRLLVADGWHRDIARGTGTTLLVDELVAGLAGRGHLVERVGIACHVDDDEALLERRIVFNETLDPVVRKRTPDAVIGVDFDGFALDRSLRAPLISLSAALFSDLAHREDGAPAELLRRQIVLERRAFARASRVIVGSAFAAMTLRHHDVVEPSKVTVVPFGRARLQPAVAPVAPAAPLAGAPSLLAVGRLYPRKRTDLLVLAAAKLRARGMASVLHVVGGGPEFDRLRSLAGALADTAAVHFWGPVDAATLSRLWASADLVCHASEQESFGFATLEAMMLRKPIVAARAGATPEVVGDAALLVEPGSAAALADAIETLWRDPTRRAELALRGLARSAQFTREAMAERFEAVVCDEVRMRRSSD